ncbi:MAG TPA: preprotein translocase subunit SecE [Chloroflexota bacterium]
MAQTKSPQSDRARTGLNREQGRRGTVVGAGGAGRGRGSAVVTGGGAPPRAPMPLAGAGGRRGRGNPLDFVRDVRSELRKVAWPNQRETVNLTVVVIAFSVAVGLLLGGIDFLFQELFRYLLAIQGGGGL